MGTCERTLLELRTWDPQVLKDFSLEEVILSTSAEDLLPPQHSEILLIMPLTEEINPSLSAKPAVILSQGDARQHSTDVPHG